MEELGLFPLGIVLLPSEHVPLHIFEPRYRELIAECLDEQQEFGVIYADGDGVRDVGTRARVIDVLEEFADGRLNVVVEGGARFRVERLTRGRSFLTAIVAPAPDGYGRTDPDTAARAVGSFRALAAVAGAEPDEVDETASQLSFELAAQVELPSDAKQELLELDEEQHRLEFVIRLLDSVRETLLAVRELGEHAKTNGSRRPQPK
jgi:Lon protease-like protein